MAETVDQWAARQPDVSNIADPMERKNALESWQMQRPGYVNPMDFNNYESYAGAANIRDEGSGSGQDLTNRANFYGMTIENYQNALSGDPTRPMGGNQAVYGSQLLSPLEQRAAEVARGQGISTMSPETLALAKANPDVFNAASQRFQNYLATTYPGTLEYESVLSGPMQFSNAGVKYPKIDDTTSMYILDPRTNQIIKNPNYKGTKKAADGGLMSLTDSPRQSGLHQFAEQVASQGRGDDSLLVHMTPDEVRNLQQFAQANGTTLTINPITGLPEAGMLSDLFKTIAPIALGAFLGPAGVALGGPGLTAGMAGLATGGITALATGSLSRGLMAGLGAYGGAGIGESLMNAGTGALSQSVGAGLSEEAAQQAVASKLASATPMETLTAGFNSATASPAAMGTFAKNNLTNIGMAAAPIMAGAMVPTTTKMPENTNPAYIRQKLYDPYTQTYKSLTPVKASEFGGRNFSDAYTNPQTGQMDTLQPRAPSGFAGGGIVALANGGTPGYAPGGYVPSDAEIFNYFKTPGLSDAKIAQDMQTFGVSAADIARATGTQGQQSDYEKRFVNTLVAPGTDSSEFLKATNAVGLQNQNLASAMQNAGLSQAAQYSLTHNLNDAAGTATAPATAQNFYNTIGYTAGALPGDQGGLEGLYANINYSAKGLQDKINSGALTVTEAQRLADEEMRRVGVSQKDLTAATGKDLFGLFTAKKAVDKTCGTGYHWDETTQSCVKDTVIDKKVVDKTCATGYHFDEATQQCVKNISAVDTTTATVTTPTSLVTAPATTLPVGVSGTTGPSIFGGGATVNPNGTITTSPVIPGIPVGGFTGMESLRNAYTTGGGSLGYIPKAPKTMAEFEQLYNTQTGDSLAAYDYLMGKGGGKYPVQSKAASTAEGIMRPYWSAGMKYKPRFLTAGKDGTVTESSTNPNAPKAGDAKAAELTKAKTIDIVDSSGYNTETYTAVLQEDGTYLAGNGKRYDVTGKQIAAGGGMMGYAMGGGLGSLGSYSDGGRLLKGPGDGVSDSIPATIGAKNQPARLADGEFVIPARIVSELGNGSTDAGAKKLYAMMDRVQRARGKTTGKNKVAANSRADKYLPA